MICLFVLTFAYGALSAPTTAPNVNVTIGLTQAFGRIDSDGSGTADVSEFLKVFDKYDLNDDGKMSKAEYIASTNAPKSFAEAVFNSIDSDHDGFILRTDVKNVIPAFDTDGDGAVSLAEFVTRYKQIFAALQTSPIGK
ncbi:calmodulin-like protein 30 [Haliotis rubra]|uniref:calmodulin-like protein 30 n=1 Tax=Haliotis rubra TaxID=36100 RepID=UPI001EE54F40|nr:calmodulin-like protein 30 [Haliotis rubra]